MFITKQAYEKLIHIQQAAEKLVAEHPGNYYSDDFVSETRCFYCGELEINTPEMETKGHEMHLWLEANPNPQMETMPIKRKEVLPEDMPAWDRENGRLHRSYYAKLGNWRKAYDEKYTEVWGDPKEHPGTVIHHKEDCLWLILKNSLA